VHDLVERAAIGVADRRQRPVCGIPEREEHHPVAILGESQQLTGERKIPDARMAAADAKVSRRQATGKSFRRGAGLSR